MSKTKKKILMLGAFLIFGGMVHASTIDISAATNKPTYQLGEYVTISVTAYNPNPQPVTLYFSSSLQATYLIDNTFDWTQGKGFAQEPTQQTISPYGSYSWNLIHDNEMAIYPLGLGNHSVTGTVINYGTTSPIEFEVVPEPATFLLLATGWAFIRHKRRISNSTT